MSEPRVTDQWVERYATEDWNNPVAKDLARDLRDAREQVGTLEASLRKVADPASAVARPVLNDGRSGPKNPEQPGTRSASEVADTERAQRFIRDHKIEAPNKLTDEWLTSRLAAAFAEVRAAALEEALGVVRKQKDFYDGLRDKQRRKSADHDFYDEHAGICHILERSIEALATRSTEEPTK